MPMNSICEGDVPEDAKLAITQLKGIEAKLSDLRPLSSSLKNKLDLLRARTAISIWSKSSLKDVLRQSRRLDYECGVHGESLFRHLCSLDTVEGGTHVRNYRKQLVQFVKGEMNGIDLLRSACIKLSRFIMLRSSQRPQVEAQFEAQAAVEQEQTEEEEEVTGDTETEQREKGEESLERQRYHPVMKERPFENGVQLVLSLPGVHRDSVSIDLKGRQLNISGAQQFDPNKYFIEKVEIPESFDLANATSEMKRGMLVISLPYTIASRKYASPWARHSGDFRPPQNNFYGHGGFGGFGAFRGGFF